MRGKPLKRFADTLPQDEKEALYALCEPDWCYEVVGIKKGDEGILMPIAFYWFNGRTAPLYRDGAITWLHEFRPSLDPYCRKLSFPEQEAILKKYDDLELKYSDAMKPYPWQGEIFCGIIREPILWCLHWFLLHDPREIYYPDALWDERSTVLEYFGELLDTDYIRWGYEDRFQKELAITKESVQDIQLQLKELDEYEKQLRARREHA